MQAPVSTPCACGCIQRCASFGSVKTVFDQASHARVAACTWMRGHWPTSVKLCATNTRRSVQASALLEAV